MAWLRPSGRAASCCSLPLSPRRAGARAAGKGRLGKPVPGRVAGRVAGSVAGSCRRPLARALLLGEPSACSLAPGLTHLLPPSPPPRAPRRGLPRAPPALPSLPRSAQPGGGPRAALGARPHRRASHPHPPTPGPGPGRPRCPPPGCRAPGRRGGRGVATRRPQGPPGRGAAPPLSLFGAGVPGAPRRAPHVCPSPRALSPGRIGGPGAPCPSLFSPTKGAWRGPPPAVGPPRGAPAPRSPAPPRPARSHLRSRPRSSGGGGGPAAPGAPGPGPRACRRGGPPRGAERTAPPDVTALRHRAARGGGRGLSGEKAGHSREGGVA